MSPSTDRRVLFIFVDGIGVGRYDARFNPCADSRIQLFNQFLNRPREKALPYGGMNVSLDATLGVQGLPQSATGQTTLLTGINAAQLLGKHLSGFPNPRLREILASESLLIKFKRHRKKVAFINAYRPIFFKLGPQLLIRFLSVTSIANWKADLKFFSFEDLKTKKSIYHDFTNIELIHRGYDIPPLSAEEAGCILATAAKSYDFCLYEYFKTDKVGHSQHLGNAIALIIQLEQFILNVIKHSDLTSTLILVTSDHGNIEDLSVKSHTTNPVPLLVWGQPGETFVTKAQSIQDIANLVFATAFK